LVISHAIHPLTYYFVTYIPRYRMPIVWILLILAGTAGWSG
jgi:hypothetical protein